ncbi:hypothetical protein [Solobacterium sp.]|jgi:gp078|uniref:hypothetical protein n=1 Tax=Solobacterium sp. TaxID=2060878 RepID=UPI001CAF13E8|nr:hypothetical protein [Solobacterium sp.]MBF1086359.1 hypothetical protein [Solobacterium sp.]DAP16556.1 MAG TPA: hypothetical protein [Caudoviricetes sp.]
MAYENLNLEGVKVIFRNFEGRPSKYNQKGSRNFSAILTDDDAKRAEDLGFNVRYRPSRDEGEPDIPTLAVSLSYDNFPPNIYTVVTTSVNGVDRHKKVLMNAETIGMLDYADIINCDITIRPYHWEANGKTGVKAYVKNMYVNIMEDPFYAKYSDDISEESGEVDGGEDIPF